MNQSNWNVLLVSVALTMSIFLSNCGSMQPLASQQPPSPIVIDGDAAEWQNAASLFVQDRLMVAVCNDTDNLYLCLTTQDPELGDAIRTQGLTVWFDSEGSNDRELGFNFPLASRFGGSRGTRQSKDVRDPRQAVAIPDAPLFEFDIVGKTEKDRCRYPITNTIGVKTDLKRNREGSISYELRVPLEKNDLHPYGIGAKRGTHIGLGIELGSGESTKGRRGMGMEGPPEGMPDEGMPPGGGMEGGGREGGGRPQRGGGMAGPGQRSGSPSGLSSLWFDVALHGSETAK